MLWLIQGLLEQSHTRYEIIISSSEQVRETLIEDLESINARKKVKIIHSFDDEKCSSSEILHRLSLQATGDVLVFVDSNNRRMYVTPTFLENIAETWARSDLYCYALVPNVEKTGTWSLTKKIEEAVLMFSYFVFLKKSPDSQGSKKWGLFSRTKKKEEALIPNSKCFFHSPFLFLDSAFYFEKISIEKGSTMRTFKKQIFTRLAEDIQKTRVQCSDTARETDKIMQTIISDQVFLFLENRGVMFLFLSSYLIAGLLVFFSFWYILLLQVFLSCLLRILCGFICNKKIAHTFVGLAFLPVMYVGVPFLFLSQIFKKDQ